MTLVFFSKLRGIALWADFFIVFLKFYWLFHFVRTFNVNNVQQICIWKVWVDSKTIDRHGPRTLCLVWSFLEAKTIAKPFPLQLLIKPIHNMRPSKKAVRAQLSQSIKSRISPRLADCSLRGWSYIHYIYLHNCLIEGRHYKTHDWGVLANWQPLSNVFRWVVAELFRLFNRPYLYSISYFENIYLAVHFLCVRYLFGKSYNSLRREVHNSATATRHLHVTPILNSDRLKSSITLLCDNALVITLLISIS